MSNVSFTVERAECDRFLLCARWDINFLYSWSRFRKNIEVNLPELLFSAMAPRGQNRSGEKCLKNV
jgi:hypothetical protein